eukprot:2456326-Rhodomonas_salina.2
MQATIFDFAEPLRTWISAIAVPPSAATPIPKPAIPCSHRGVLKTRCFPNLSWKHQTDMSGLTSA